MEETPETESGGEETSKTGFGVQETPKTIGVGSQGLTGVPALVGAAQATLAMPDRAGAGGVAGLRKEPEWLHVLEVWGHGDIRGAGGHRRDLEPAQDPLNFDVNSWC